MTAQRKADLLGTAFFLLGLAPQAVALGLFLCARRIWRHAR